MPATSNLLEEVEASVSSLRTLVTDAYPGLMPQRHDIVCGRVPERAEACYHALYLIDIILGGLKEMTEQKKSLPEEDWPALLASVTFICGILWAQGFDTGPMEIDSQAA